MLVRRLQPWHDIVGKRLVRSPKVSVRDSGLLALETLDDLLGHPVVGGSWEGFCVEALIAAAPAGTEPLFYRTAAGAALALVLRRPGGETGAIEIKRATRPKVSRGFHLAVEDIKGDHRMLVHAGERDVPMAPGLRAMPLASAIDQVRAL